MTTQSITSNQRKQVVRFMEDGLDALPLTKAGAQRVIEHGGDMQERLKSILTGFSVPDDFANEEVSSKYVYPKGYRMKPLAYQIAVLMKRFGLSGSTALSYAENLPELPDGAEGWFAIPRFETVAKTYNDAVETVLAKIADSRKFHSYHKGELGPKYLRQHEHTEEMFAKLGETQQGDILIVPAQFSVRHRGKSVRRARAIFAGNEFGLGAFAIGCMLLTQPERLVSYDNLWIDCLGDEYAPAADGVFSHAPIFFFYDGLVGFGAHRVGHADDIYGSASGFVPQS